MMRRRRRMMPMRANQSCQKDAASNDMAHGGVDDSGDSSWETGLMFWVPIPEPIRFSG